MSELKKAMLHELVKKGKTETPRNGIPVQFNPETLKLGLQNVVEGGKAKGREVRQYVGKTSAELSFDLVFDTAEEGTTGSPRSVRDRTKAIEKFVLPRVKGKKRRPPPKVLFEWGNLRFPGIISSLNIDFELFSSDGIPLRARMSVTIKEQDSKYEVKKDDDPGTSAGAPADVIANAAAAQVSAGVPGTAGGGATDTVAAAIAGESLSDFAARHGLDPSAWRALADGVPDPLNLAAGQEIPFLSDLPLGTGLGGSTGFGTRALESTARSLGIDLDTADSFEAGFDLSAAGGLGPAMARAATRRSDEAARAARRGFMSPGDPVRPAPRAPTPQSRGGGRDRSGPGDEGSPVAPPPDPRSSSWGSGVPLRTRVTPASGERMAASRGNAVLTTRPGQETTPAPPGRAPWIGSTPARPAAERAASCGCGCTKRQGGC